MILNFFQSSKAKPVPQQLYGAVVAQSRMPEFYRHFAIPDSVTGRFDMLSLHLFLFSHRLSREADPLARQLSQDVFDEFTTDLDDALRALGIGDTSVPKRKQAMVKGFYAQIEEFAPAIDTGNWSLLADRLSARFYAGAAKEEASRLADYCRSACEKLGRIELPALLEGRLSWPDPAG
jgi:cytochrome b pre-mRNA-processing protein 3